MGMKTAVSIPDELFSEADRLAKRLKRSRSRVYADALREYVLRHTPDRVTEQLDSVYGTEPASLDDFAGSAARRVLEDSEW